MRFGRDSIQYRVGKTHCQCHQDPSKSVSIFLRETEANSKMVFIWPVFISRCSTVHGSCSNKRQQRCWCVFPFIVNQALPPGGGSRQIRGGLLKGCGLCVQSLRPEPGSPIIFFRSHDFFFGRDALRYRNSFGCRHYCISSNLSPDTQNAS